MSGTLLPSSCREILGHSDYLYSELPSPIPLENRPIKYFSDEIFVNTLEGQADLLTELLSKFDARPAIVHTSYAEAKALKELMPQDDVVVYESPDTKIATLSSAEGKQVSVLSGGATTGLNLKDDRCRLNVVLRGAFANLGGDFVRRRKSLEGGEEWYVESVLRHLVQACGRSTRGPEDYSMTVIADQRLISLANRNRDLLPNYFLEAFDRRLDDLRKCS
jgi:Rad3-related DNA helicase